MGIEVLQCLMVFCYRQFHMVGICCYCCFHFPVVEKVKFYHLLALNIIVMEMLGIFKKKKMASITKAQGLKLTQPLV